MILIYAHNSADDNGGKYQKVNTSANAICKYVTGFSFIAGFASVTRGCHKTPIENIIINHLVMMLSPANILINDRKMIFCTKI
ncbi:hypothetical protein [Klebsiella quasipneumoniae]|uniref:hypothetical protein n=1 Tax=Klebsiella quasipneumoniae TaxID=1463165 RepID=UPI0032DAAC2D